MAKEKEVCNAHELLLTNFADIQKGQSRLYDLDREKADRLGSIEVSVARLEVSTEAGFTRLESQYVSYTETMSKEIEKLSALVMRMSNRKRWTPKAVIALVSSVFGSGGIGYAIGNKLLEAIK